MTRKHAYQNQSQQQAVKQTFDHLRDVLAFAGGMDEDLVKIKDDIIELRKHYTDRALKMKIKYFLISGVDLSLPSYHDPRIPEQYRIDLTKKAPSQSEEKQQEQHSGINAYENIAQAWYDKYPKEKSFELYPQIVTVHSKKLSYLIKSGLLDKSLIPHEFMRRKVEFDLKIKEQQNSDDALQRQFQNRRLK